MGFHLHILTRRLIRKLFTTGISSRKRFHLYKSLEQCSICSNYYVLCQTIESALCKTDNPYTIFSIERTAESLFANLYKNNLRISSKQPFSRTPALIFASATIVISILFFFYLIPFSDRLPLPIDSQLSQVHLIAKGSSTGNDLADFGIRVFRVTNNQQAVREESNLSIDDIITFTYTYADSNGGNLALFGIQNKGEIRWYYPEYGEEESIYIKGNKIDEPLGDGISLSVNHNPGLLRIVALFTKEPLSIKEIEAAAEALFKETGSIKSMEPLIFKDLDTPPTQHSVMLEIGGPR